MSQRMHYTAASPAGMKALGAVYGYVRQSGLPSRLVDLVFLRVSQLNGCVYCIDMNSRDVLKAGLPVEHLHLTGLQSENMYLRVAELPLQRCWSRRKDPT
jgi:AhpD family alkylhydroperoxidase